MLSLGVTLVMTPLSHAYTGYTSFRGAVYSTMSHIGLGATVCTNGYPNTLSHLESDEIPPRPSLYDRHAVFKDLLISSLKGETSSTRSVKITPPNFRCEVWLSLAFQRMVASHLPLLRSNRFRRWQPSEVPSLVEAVRFPRGLAVSFPRVSQVFPWEGRRYSSSERFANRTISYLALSDRRIRTCTFRIWG